VLLDGKKINGDKKNPLTPEKLKQLVAEAKPVNETKPTAVPGTVPAR
jgi:hypothetical protein